MCFRFKVRQSAMSSSWPIPEPALTASEPVDTHRTTDLQNSPQARMLLLIILSAILFSQIATAI